MSRNLLIKELEDEQLKESIPAFSVGDTLKISTKIIEGEKERIQVFQGTVIARRGAGASETIALHRVFEDEGMERVFYLHSPKIAKIELIKKGDVRRSKLYYLRGKTGKSAKVKEKINKKPKVERQETHTPSPFVPEQKLAIKKQPKAVKVEAAVESVSSEVGETAL